jgi:DNA-binding MarR family transcriptional regulator
MGPNNNPVYLIQHLANVLAKQSERLLRTELGIGYSQFRILMVLEWNPRVSQRTIADSLGQTEASISRQIKMLTAEGMLVSKPDPENRRRHITTPTPKGMQLTESANAILRRHFGPELAGVGDEQLAALTHGLQKLHLAVCRRGQAGACDHPLGF